MIPPRQKFDGTPSIAGNFDLLAFLLEIEADAIRDVGIVLHNQDAGNLAPDIPSRPRRRLFRVRLLAHAGLNVTTKRLPRPAPSESATIRPPCFRSNARTTKRPRPSPDT